MRPDRESRAARSRTGWLLLGAIALWLVVQNTALLVAASILHPALMVHVVVAGARLAAQVAPFAALSLATFAAGIALAVVSDAGGGGEERVRHGG